MLNLISLKDTTKCEAIENCLHKNNLDLKILFRISTDNAPAMIDKEKEAIKLLIDNIESNNKTHNCCKIYDLFIIYNLIHQQNLCV